MYVNVCVVDQTPVVRPMSGWSIVSSSMRSSLFAGTLPFLPRFVSVPSVLFKHTPTTADKERESYTMHTHAHINQTHMH